MMRSAPIEANTAQALPERRAEQRFPLQLPIVVKILDLPRSEYSSVTRDISARGAFFFLRTALAHDTLIEMLVTLPAEITLSEDICVRCRGKVVRALPPTADGQSGIAAVIETYNFTR